MEQFSAKVLYEFSYVELRGKKVPAFRERFTSEWITYSDAAKKVGVDMSTIRNAVRRGRPYWIRGGDYYVVNGAHEGKWVSFLELSRLTGCSNSHCRRLSDEETATITWRAPGQDMPKGTRGGYRPKRQDRGLTRPTTLEGVCHVAAQFNRIAWPCHAG